MARPGILHSRYEYKNRDPYKYIDKEAIYGLGLYESGRIFSWIMEKRTKTVSFSASRNDAPDFVTIDGNECLAMIRNDMIELGDLDQIKIAYRSFLA